MNEFLKLDATNQEELDEALDKLKPELVIVPAAMPNVNKCEQEPELSHKNNVELIENVITTMKKYDGRKIVLFSTDYLFNGKNGPYSEDETPNPLNIYGKHKLECEKEIIASGLDYLIVRTTGIFGWEKQRKNFMYRVIDTLNRKEDLIIPNDQFANPTYVKDLVSATMILLKEGKNGIFNVAGPEIMERETLARRIARFYNLDESHIIGQPTSYFRGLANRPLNSGLRIDKIRSLGICMRTVEQALEDMKIKKSEEDKYI